jgi:hypothetical protein
MLNTRRGALVFTVACALFVTGCEDKSTPESASQAGASPDAAAARTEAAENAEIDAELNKDPFIRAYLQAIVPCDEAHGRYADLAEAGGAPAAEAAKAGIEICERAAQQTAALPPPKGRETAPAVCAGSPRAKAEMIRVMAAHRGDPADLARVEALVAESDSKVDACTAVALAK